MEPISRERLASLTNSDRRTIRKRLSEAGIVPIAQEGRADLYDSAIALRAILAPVGPSGDLDLQQERAALARSQREHYDLRNEETKGRLVPIEKVAAVVESEYTAIRSRARALPTALAPELAHQDERHVQVIIERAVDELLTELRGPAPRSTAGGPVSDA